MLGTFAGTCIGLASLAANGQALAMTNAAVAANFHHALDVQSGLTTEIAFHYVAFQALTQLGFIILSQVFHAGIGVDSGLFQNFGCAGSADAINIGKSDFNTLILRQVNAGESCHSSQSILSLISYRFCLRELMHRRYELGAPV